jgi:RNAse (barnase) inhibitor barstar
MDEDEVFQEHITVDLTDCKYVMAFWDRIKTAFEFPEFFGKNWSAFWDLISKECPAHMVTVIGANKLPKDWKTLKGIHYAEMTRHILQKNKEYKAKYNYEFDYEFVDV